MEISIFNIKRSLTLTLDNVETQYTMTDDEYRLITSDASYHGIEAYGLKSYWKDNEYIEECIDTSLEFKPLSELLEKG